MLRMRKGDLEAKNELIERNMRLVAHVAKKYQNYEEDMEDLISIGTIGLIKAVGTYKENYGSRLATYAARCIDNELLMALRSEKKKNKDPGRSLFMSRSERTKREIRYVFWMLLSVKRWMSSKRWRRITNWND